MKSYCEIISKSILPSLRSIIAKELLNKGMNQSQIAKKLGVSQGAVSQYLHSVRGSKWNSKIRNNENVYNEIKKFCISIRNKNFAGEELCQEICKLCKLIRKEKLICREHKAIYPLNNCKLCFE